MSKEKQIDGYGTDTEKELYRDIWEGLGIQDYADECIWKKARVENCALSLSKKGYSKQSEGHWHYNPDGMDWGLGAWQCSLCACRNDNLPMDKNIKPLQWAGAKYCPNCGAKMKGGAE